MDDYIELDVERDAVARALGVVPGVAVADDAGGPDAEDDGGPDPTPVPGADPADADGGATARLGALWRQWGLLGTGVTLVALGAGLVGLWWYRRRSADGSTAEEATEEWDEWTPSETMDSPPPSVDTPSPTGPADGDDAGDAEDEPTPEPQQTALGEQAARSEQTDDTAVRGRREDREDVDWSVREDRTPGGATASPADDRAAGEATEADADESSAEDERDDLPGASIDPAPLLGAAFLIATSALGRWARREREADAGQ